jgi:hypothetical protein
VILDLRMWREGPTTPILVLLNPVILNIDLESRLSTQHIVQWLLPPRLRPAL